jgi:hypothetical protein
MRNATSLGRLVAALLLLSLAFVAAACTATLVEPRPIYAAETPTQTRAAILRALIENQYTVESDKPGEIIARYAKPDWNMVVAISYANEVAVRYVSSENLKYRNTDSGPVIRRGYNKRVRYLSNEIGKEIAILRATNALPTVAAPPPGDGGPH